MARDRNRTLAVILAAITVMIAVLAAFPVTAKAENIVYSDVLEDLSKDESFDTNNYPQVADDYSLQVIQLAESEDRELFVYVYQPSGTTKNYTASSINISTTINDDISYYNYKLTRLSSGGTLYKYLVQNFTVKTDTTRYYAISSIYRPFNEDEDEQASNGNTVTEVNFEVAKQYCFSTINGNPYVSVVDIETIVVTDKFVGFVRYDDGFKLCTTACDSHFVAFSTDKDMDKLLEADVYYTSQTYYRSYVILVGVEETFGDKEDNYAYLTYTDAVEHTGNGLFAGTYTWERIQTVEEFIEDTENYTNVYTGAVLNVSKGNIIDDDAKAELETKEWVLRFAETDYTLIVGDGSNYTHSTLVGDVTILRLKFETAGVVYNLGVIDNKQTGSGAPINKTTVNVEVTKSGKWILALLALVLLVVLLWPLMPLILKAIWFVVSAPYKLVKTIIEAIRKRKR